MTFVNRFVKGFERWVLLDEKLLSFPRKLNNHKETFSFHRAATSVGCTRFSIEQGLPIISSHSFLSFYAEAFVPRKHWFRVYVMLRFPMTKLKASAVGQNHQSRLSRVRTFFTWKLSSPVHFWWLTESTSFDRKDVYSKDVIDVLLSSACRASLRWQMFRYCFSAKSSKLEWREKRKWFWDRSFEARDILNSVLEWPNLRFAALSIYCREFKSNRN